MAKGFKVYHTVLGKEPLLREVVFEIRFVDGQLYLDRTGRYLKSLVEDNSDWIVVNQPNPQGTTAYNPRTGTRLAFSISMASLHLDKSTTDEDIQPEDIQSFLSQLEHELARLTDELEIGSYSRIGYREQYYFTFDKRELAEKWLIDLGLAVISPKLASSFGAAEIDGLQYAVTMASSDCRYRINLDVHERSAQVPVGSETLNIKTSGATAKQKKLFTDILKQNRQRQINAAYAVILDIDAFLLEPRDPDFKSFVSQCNGTNLQRFRNVLSNDDPKK